MPFFYFNGTIHTDEEPVFTAGNKALRYGEGLIETMFWSGRHIRFFERHVQRMQRSLALLDMPVIAPQQLQQISHKVVMANDASGPGIIRAQFFNDPDAPLMVGYKHLPASVNGDHKTLSLGISRKSSKNADAYSSLKTSSRLSYSMATKEAALQQWDDALLLNAAGNVVESTISNVFYIKDKALYTPPLSEGCIAGIMREVLLEQGTIAGMPLSEKAFDTDTLDNADEIFLTNAIRGIQPVSLFNGKILKTDLCRKIANAIPNTDL